jgi:hypothetical protein
MPVCQRSEVTVFHHDTCPRPRIHFVHSRLIQLSDSLLRRFVGGETTRARYDVTGRGTAIAPEEWEEMTLDHDFL